MSVCGLADILFEVNPEWESWARFLIGLLNWGGSSGSESRRSKSSASEIRLNPNCNAASRGLLCSPYHIFNRKSCWISVAQLLSVKDVKMNDEILIKLSEITIVARPLPRLGCLLWGRLLRLLQLDLLV